MKRVIIFFILFVVVFLNACSTNKESQVVTKEDFSQAEKRQQEYIQSIDGLEINNEAIDKNDTGYSIDDLEKFFNNNKKAIYLEDIHRQFPIRYLREVKVDDTYHNYYNHEYYIAFPVSEGGKLLIFFMNELKSGKLAYRFSLYVYRLPVEADFEKISIGDSYEDVMKLAPCTQLQTLLSSRVESYSLLAEGGIMLCTYDRLQSDDYIINQMSVISADDPQFPYANCIPSDLIP